MKKWIKTLIGCAFVVILAACSATPIVEVQTPVYGHDIAQIEKAIMEAGAGRNWFMERVQLGVINAHLIVRHRHRINVRIDYSAKGYQINHVSSQNMKEKDGQIHKSYVRWVDNLDNDIKERLSTH